MPPVNTVDDTTVVSVDRFHFQHLAGVIVLGQPGTVHVGIPDDADTALVRWVTTVAELVHDGYGLHEAQHFARQQMLPAEALIGDDGSTRCHTVTAGLYGVPAEVVRRRLDDGGLDCCSDPHTPRQCVPALHPRDDFRIVLIHG